MQTQEADGGSRSTAVGRGSAGAAEPLLSLRRIGKHFGSVRALSDITIDIPAGAVTALVGDNGAGKSTLIKAIAGIAEPDEGELLWEGQPVRVRSPRDAAELGIATVYQDLALCDNLDIVANMFLGREPRRGLLLDERTMEAGATRALAELKVVTVRSIRQAVGSLSGGQRQAVAVAKAVMWNAKLVIMDEPTSSLTRHEVAALVRLVAELKKSGICIVFVSHRLDEVMEIAERVTVLRDGAKVGDYPAREMNDRKLATLMTGKAFEYATAATDFNSSETVLSVRGLTRVGQYSDVSLDIRAGEIVGLTGLLGSGRTEFALSLFGMNPPTSGEIRLEGRRLALLSNAQAIEEGIAYVSEDRLTLGLVLEQPISSNILVTVLDKLTNGFGLVPEAIRRREAQHWIGNLAIKAPNAENAVRTLSGGNQQRVVLAKWMATKPKLLILDSPTVGVDIAAKDGIYEVVRALAASGVAILLISDETPEVYYHTHRVLVMRQGRLVAELVPHASSEAELQAAIDD